ncbi:MFS transporter [Calidifontibacter sp. DB0510]|uniref:MFS transporter n=1 Tax=Metallococcus carri TaxID=1656884 RepID=A0A967B4E5_9MICO|nr:MFS transporter [Metallococcus carri]NHN54416.1 MFS transporter [Metallococcus carri]NOP36745.1 MFS transporter [Calidifontibacter sp. DB2511S]
MRRVLRHHDVRWLMLGQGLSWLGDGFVSVALAVAVLTHGGSAADLGLPIGATMAGRLIFSLVGGVWADRLPPTVIMVSSDLVRAALAAAVAWMFATGDWNLAILTVTFGLFGAVSAFFMPAMMSLKRDLVEPAERQKLNGLLSSLQTGAAIAGPVLAGGLVAIAGAPIGFAANAASFVISALCVLRVRARPERAEPARFLADLRGGFSAIVDRPWLSAQILMALVYHVGNGAALVLIQVIAVQSLGGARAVGLTEAAIGLGSLLGALLGTWVRPRRPLVCTVPFLVSTPLGMLPLVRPWPLPVVLVGLALGFAGLMVYGVVYETVVQQEVPGQLYARVASWDQLGSWAVIPLSSALGGVLAASYGAGRVLAVCVALMTLACLAPLFVRASWHVRYAGASAH